MIKSSRILAIAVSRRRREQTAINPWQFYNDFTLPPFAYDRAGPRWGKQCG